MDHPYLKNKMLQNFLLERFLFFAVPYLAANRTKEPFVQETTMASTGFVGVYSQWPCIITIILKRRVCECFGCELDDNLFFVLV